MCATSLNWIASSSSSTTGKTPVIQATTVSQASQEMVRSATRTNREDGNAALSTRTDSRITAKDSNTGMAILNTAKGRSSPSITRRAP